MRVAYFTHGDDTFGAPRALIEMIEQLKGDFNIKPIVITPVYNKVNQYCRENNIENFVVPYFECGIVSQNSRYLYFLKKYRYLLFNMIAILKLVKILKQKKVNIIHSNVSVIDIGYIMAGKLNIPHVWHIRESGLENNWEPYQEKNMNSI